MNTLPEVLQEQVPDVVSLQAYKDIFLKLKTWGMFEHSDIERNRIQDAGNLTTIPDFVRAFERKLARKPRLHHDVRCFLDLSVCCWILTVSVDAYWTAEARHSCNIF
jgi:hypothetical protein